MRTRRRMVWLCLVLVSLFPAAVHAQLRGIIRDGPTRAGLGGAVVAVLDAAGATAARTITNADGRFSVAIDARAASLRITRIGYRPNLAPLPAAGAPVDLAMERIPPTLTAVRVNDNEVCPGSEDRGSAFQLWDQARAGLLSAVVARELKPAMATTVMFESHLAPNDERVRQQTKKTDSGRTTRPFIASQSPVYFARHGYILDDPAVRIYNAPDADVLLDESFATTHCFHVQAADASHRGQIGVAFSPSPGRDTLTDVTGVIWLDAAVPQLRSLDFLYTALERAAMAAKSGGHIEFRSMANGFAFIERWHLRFPSLEIVPPPPNRVVREQLRPIMRRDRTDYRIHEIVEAGGIVLNAKWDDGTEFHDVPALVRGTVTQRRTNAPVANAIVTLVGTQDTVTTNAAGQFEIAAIPGKYSVSASDTALHSYVQSRLTTQPVEAIRAQTVTTRLELAPIDDVLDDLCHDRVVDSTVVLLGHVYAPDRARLPSAVVTSTWPEYSLAGRQVAVRAVRRDSDVDDEGRFFVCGVRIGRPVRMRVSMGKDALADTTIRLDRPDLTQQFEWRIAPLSARSVAPRP